MSHKAFVWLWVIPNAVHCLGASTCTVWKHSLAISPGDKKPMESILRWATKVILGLCDLSYEERLAWVEIPSMAYWKAIGDMTKVFKFKYTHELYRESSDLLRREASHERSFAETLPITRKAGQCGLTSEKSPSKPWKKGEYWKHSFGRISLKLGRKWCRKGGRHLKQVAALRPSLRGPVAWASR